MEDYLKVITAIICMNSNFHYDLMICNEGNQFNSENVYVLLKQKKYNSYI